MSIIDPTIRHMHKFQTTSEFEAAYYGEDYHTPWVSAVVETEEPAYNKLEITSITLSNLTWATDVPASGGTADKNNCTYTVIGYTPDGKGSNITALATVTGSAVVESSVNTERHTAGTLTLTATFSGLTDSDSVTIYQAAFVPAVTGITLDNLRRLNDKGLVERDHVTKKDPFYLYKAWWNPTLFVHICGKDYTKKTGRVIKCYTNNTGTATLYVNGTQVDTASITDYIVTFTQMNFNSGDVIRVDAGTTSDTFTFA